MMPPKIPASNNARKLVPPRFWVFAAVSFGAEVELADVTDGFEAEALGFSVTASGALSAVPIFVVPAPALDVFFFSACSVFFIPAGDEAVDGVPLALGAAEGLDPAALEGAGFFGSLAFRSIVVGLAVSFASGLLTSAVAARFAEDLPPVFADEPAGAGLVVPDAAPERGVEAAVFLLSPEGVLLLAWPPPDVLDFCAPVFGVGRCGGFTIPVFLLRDGSEICP